MKYALDFETEKTVDREGKSCYHAWLTSRPDIKCEAATETEALASLAVRLVPSDTSTGLVIRCIEQGILSDPIQQAIGLLSGALDSAVRERGSIVLRNLNSDPEHLGYNETKDLQEKGRLSELIGNLGTAIAALCRVKHD
jgi:hypothetical protein